MDPVFEQTLTALAAAGDLTFEKEKELFQLSSFRIGGPVEYAVFPKTERGLAAAYAAVKQAGLQPRVVGNATNILFPDEGVRGAIIFMTALTGARMKGDLVTARAGERVTALAVKAKNKGLSGLEFCYGIPGSVGGAVYMNAGAYEHSTSEVLESSRYFDPERGEIDTLSAAEHDFSYRHSSYMGSGRILLSATYRLTPDDPAAILARMEDYMGRRKSKQPLEYPSAGSVFKRYPGYFTGKLIEDSGLKGLTVGGAQVSKKHAGFIVNIGGARASDVKELVEIITETIYKNYGIRIERELIYFE